MNEVSSNLPMSSSVPSVHPTEKVALDEVSTAYRVNRNKTAKKVKRDKILIIAKFHFLLLILALVVYVLPFPIKFLIVIHYLTLDKYR